jgi:multidrug efflux pump subunit AcrB
MLISLSSSGQTAPNYWLNFQNGVNYQVAVQTPQYKMDTLQDLKNTPVVAPNLPRPELLGNLATVERRESPVIVNHYNVQPVFDVLANVQGRDLGGVADGVAKVVDSFKSKLPRGTFLSIRGQVQSMNSSFAGLGAGLIFAIVLVYFLMAVNFQSWTDPFIIIMALPGALCGIIWMLFITGTTLNVPSLMGAIMAIGVATANSILVVTFANDERCAHENKNAFDAALACRFHALASRDNDRAGNDYRNVADVARIGRGRRTKRAARARRDWRVARRYCYNAVFCPSRLQFAPEKGIHL